MLPLVRTVGQLPWAHFDMPGNRGCKGVAHKHFTNRQKRVPIAFWAYRFALINLGVSAAFERKFCLLSDDLGVIVVVRAMSLAPSASESDANG